MRLILFLICLLPLSGTKATSASDVTIANLVGLAVCATEENPLEDYCFEEEAKEAERSQLTNKIFGVTGVELIREGVGTFVPFGLLPLKKPEKEDHYERLNAQFLSYCLNEWKFGSNRDEFLPKRVQRLFAREELAELKQWFKEIKRVEQLAPKIIAVGIQFPSIWDVKADLSNLEPYCAFRQVLDGYPKHYFEFYSSKSRGLDYDMYKEVFSFVAKKELIKEQVKGELIKLVDLTTAKLRKFHDHSRSDIARYNEIMAKQQPVITEVGSGGQKYRDFEEVRFPSREQREKVAVALTRNRFESDSEFLARKEQQRVESRRETYVVREGEPRYDLEDQSFVIYKFCSKELKRRLYRAPEKRFNVATGQNAYGATREISEGKYFYQQHSIFSTNFDSDAYKQVFFGSTFDLRIPYALEEAKKLGRLESYCIVEYFPELSDSFREHVDRIEPTFSDPERRIETWQKMWASPVGWVLQDLDSGEVIFHASFEMDPQIAEKAQRARTLLPSFESMLLNLDDLEKLLMRQGN